MRTSGKFALIRTRSQTVCISLTGFPLISQACHYRTVPFDQRGDGAFDSNVEYAHRCFDAHATQFLPARENLLAGNATMESIGMSFLPFQRPSTETLSTLCKRLHVQTRWAAEAGYHGF